MNTLNLLKGTGVALITPFDAQKNIDSPALKRMVDYVINNGVNYIVVLGTTGETATLTLDEKKRVVDEIVSANNGRVPLVMGAGGNDTASVLRSFKYINVNDFSAILSVSPYYNKPTQEGIYQHYKALAAESPLPLILYNVPGRTGSNISADTTIRLANDFKNIIATKEASGNFDQFMRILQHKPEGFELISGDDPYTLPLISLGAIGIISVVANVLPRRFTTMVNAALEGNFEEARKQHFPLLDITAALFEEGNPGGAKAALAHLGIIQNDMRLPLWPVSKSLNDRIVEMMDKLK